MQRVELTDEGIVLFDRLRDIAVRHNARLQAVLSDEEAATLSELLERLRAAAVE